MVSVRSQAVATPLLACVAPVGASSTRRRASLGRDVSIPNGALLADCRVMSGSRLINSQHLAQSLWDDTQKLVRALAPVKEGGVFTSVVERERVHLSCRKREGLT